MIIPVDILTDPSSGDLMMRGGDLVMGNATEAHTYDLVTAAKGDFKWEPTVGVGVRNYLNDNDFIGLKGSVRRELNRDGQVVQEIAIVNGQLNVNSNYE